MSNKKILKEAQRDAERMLAAEMAYGEGAGTRRKLLNAEINQKLVDNASTEYADLLNLAYEHLDQNKFAKAAIKERKNLDRAAKAGKNMRALKSGKLNNLSTGVFIVVGGAYIAHATGYDKVIKAEVKKGAKLLKDEWTVRKEGRRIRKMREAVYSVTNVGEENGS